MKSNLKKILDIQKELDLLHYPDSYRIAFEIDDFINSNSSIRLGDILNRLKSNEPWEYIREYTEFCGNNFLVNKYVLIPRIETEQIVYDTAEYVRKNNIKNIIDVGTGSGCIAISLAEQLLDLDISIYATDISNNALDVSKQNERNILNNSSINWVNTNLIDTLPDIVDSTVIVANLPYIPTDQYLNLDSSVKDYEPRLALDGGPDGLNLYRDLLNQIHSKNLDLKAIFIETEESNFELTFELFKKELKNFNIEEKSDLFERDRFIYSFLKC